MFNCLIDLLSQMKANCFIYANTKKKRINEKFNYNLNSITFLVLVNLK